MKNCRQDEHHSNAKKLIPKLSSTSIELTSAIEVLDEKKRKKSIFIPAERPLTIYLNKKELVTLMTLGSRPEDLVLGYLRNQRIIKKLDDIVSIQVDWDVNSAAVISNTYEAQQTSKRTVTTGCGQGTIFGDIQADLDKLVLSQRSQLTQSTLTEIIDVMRRHDSVYKKAGSVHGCALFKGAEMLMFVEDVGRHNAVDSIAGKMWLESLEGEGLVFYTTGRLTSEMVVKGAQMNIPFLLSRSGVTQMGVQMAKKVNLSLFGRCSGKHFYLYSSWQRFVYD